MNREKVIFITGGGSGLGKNLVKKFFDLNCKVFFTYRTERPEISQILQDSNGKIAAYQADASDYSQVVLSVEKAIETFHDIDVLINNAASAKDSSLEKSTAENFDYTIKNVLYPVYYYSKAVVPYMRNNTQGGGGEENHKYRFG